ncbi:muts domain V-domain-containing protein [Lipomyces kononenkoae]|uniref:Muts domain V-domain-containing protein n=1 Tax=Lipomyces kononenkoae TaxID=34357 RepID=A0ACC3TAE8_LIPKO
MSRHLKDIRPARHLIGLSSTSARNNQSIGTVYGRQALRRRSTESGHRQRHFISNNSRSFPQRARPVFSSASRCSTTYYETAKSITTARSSKSTKPKVAKPLPYDDSIEQGLVVTADSPADIDALADVAANDKIDKIYPTVLHEAKANMERLPNCVLLTRVGSFYELYFHQADEYAPLLNLRLAKKKTAQGPVSMAGFPFMHLDRYLKVLVQELQKYVAISEEFPNINARVGNANLGVAISDPAISELQGLEDSRSGKTNNMYIRKVCRIITPGTLIDEKFLDPTQNNYLLAVSWRERPQTDAQSNEIDGGDDERFHIGLAWLDFSTGDFQAQTSSSATILSDLARISPNEILLNKSMQSAQKIFRQIQDQQYFITYENFPEMGRSSEQSFDLSDDELQAERRKFLSAWAGHFDGEGFASGDLSRLEYDELCACNAVLHYVNKMLPGTNIKLQSPERRLPMDNMLIDANSLRALEIKKTLRDQLTSGSLLNTIKRTVTKSGTRLLADWLSSPTTSLVTIDQRHNLVQIFLNDKHLHEMVILYLKRTHDSSRAVQKLTLGRGNADDMLGLLQSIEYTAKLRTLIEGYLQSTAIEDPSVSESLRVLLERIIDLSDMERLISNAFDRDLVIRHLTAEEKKEAESLMYLEAKNDIDSFNSIVKAPKKKPQTRKGAPIETMEIMKRNASRTLSRLHKSLDECVTLRDGLERELRTLLGPTLDLRWSPSLGYYVHASGKDMARFEETETEHGNTTARCIVSRKNTRSYHLDKWTVIGNRIDSYKMLIRLEERKIFQSVRQSVLEHIANIRRNARVLDELDVVCSFATLARERKLVRPVLHNGIAHNVIGGRHPTVEYGLQERGISFVPNDCFLGSAERLWLITGPNMGGKSTFLRQNALISILAQAGSYVPANFAEIGIVDQIFTRVGSADNLYRDESTFMVEMLETANILKRATSRSFVIMDEIGRGTTPVEGLAVAYGCLHHLYYVNRSRTLFATHFHDLAEMIQNLPHAACYCTDLKEDENGGFYFMHKLRRGVNHRSHALHIAKLAGVPSGAIHVAERALYKLEKLHVGGGEEFQNPGDRESEVDGEVHEKVSKYDSAFAFGD